MPLYAGVAETNITPPPGVWLAGYALRPGPCTDVHDDLHARALVVHDGVHTAAIVSMDLIGLDFDIVGAVRAAVTADLGLPSEAILLNASHTHSGPATVSFNAMGPRDPAYVDVLMRKLGGVVRSAANRLQPASAAFGRAPAQIGVNRRARTGGTFSIGRNWGGPVLPRVDVLVLRDSRGTPFAALVTHACHAVTLDRDNLSVSADFPGAACAAIRNAFGGALTPLFLQGCCGNINPLERSTFDAVRRNGGVIADAALAAIDGAEPLACASVEHGAEVVQLPLRAPSPLAEIDARIGEQTIALAQARADGDTGRAMLHEGHLAYSRMERAAAADRALPLTRGVEVQHVRVCGISLIGLPVEPFVETAIALDGAAADPVLTLGYTNGVHNYLPTAGAFAEGGYEVTDAHRYYGRIGFAEDAERLVTAAAARLMRR